MVNEVNQVCNEIQRFVAGLSSSIMRKKVEKKFSRQYSPELVRKSIEYALDNLILQQVVDESPDDPSIQDDMIWYLKAMSPSMSEKFKNLPPEDFALIRLLHEQDNPDTRGQMPVSLAKEELMKKGIKHDDVESVWINDIVDTFYARYGDEWVRWIRLIPEFETTEEYKKAEEEAQRERDDREALRVYMADILDLASWILEALKNIPDGLSKDKIVEQLPKFPSEYIDDAFRICIEDEDIERVQRSDDVEWYRLVFIDEDDDE